MSRCGYGTLGRTRSAGVATNVAVSLADELTNSDPFRTWTRGAGQSPIHELPPLLTKSLMNRDATSIIDQEATAASSGRVSDCVEVVVEVALGVGSALDQVVPDGPNDAHRRKVRRPDRGPNVDMSRCMRCLGDDAGGLARVPAPPLWDDDLVTDLGLVAAAVSQEDIAAADEGLFAIPQSVPRSFTVIRCAGT